MILDNNIQCYRDMNLFIVLVFSHQNMKCSEILSLSLSEINQTVSYRLSLLVAGRFGLAVARWQTPRCATSVFLATPLVVAWQPLLFLWLPTNNDKLIISMVTNKQQYGNCFYGYQQTMIS